MHSFNSKDKTPLFSGLQGYQNQAERNRVHKDWLKLPIFCIAMTNGSRQALSFIQGK